MASNRSLDHHPSSIESGIESRPTRRTLHSSRDADDEPESVHSNEESSLIHHSDEEDLSSREPAGPHRRLGLLSTTFLITNRMIGTAIFSVPSSIAQSVGSAGAALTLWLVGFLLSFCGFLIYLELGSLFPRNGGEKVYLQAAYPRPPFLVSTVFATHIIFLGFTGIGTVVVAENMLLAFGITTNDWVKRGIAVAIMACIAAIHVFTKNWGIRLMNTLASIKLIVLVLIILTGLTVLHGDVSNVPHPGASFKHPFSGSSSHVTDYTVALYKVLASYQGWCNAGYVLDEVKDPRRTLKIAGILGLTSVGLLYFMVNVAYFAAATPKELGETGVTVAALFIGKVFGEEMQSLSAVLAALSSLGNLMTASFSISRVVQGFAEEQVLPFSSFFARKTHFGSPAAAFILVFLSSFIMIICVPFGDVYNFILDLGQYAMAIVQLFVVIGLFIIRRRRTHPQRTFRVWTSVACIFLVAQVYLLFSTFSNSAESGSNLPVWLTPVTSILVLSLGSVYWFYGWTLKPKMGQRSSTEPLPLGDSRDE
ncbi:amino acid transporter [Aspergillus steynii IBT 23096]|uniref:Amino acid transporter n=1 Tax=Aspergillus steynii IBT 23096 TaxID=1392250 RepID=A0A2I2GIJ0_9EURO|nr:amino acid transporter [Aspergillus steynii IBT 23096]PLB52706.1 amino acid transporter [Aspergillus steynii IBT 23096]